jgi:hypothetical protein
LTTVYRGGIRNSMGQRTPRGGALHPQRSRSVVPQPGGLPRGWTEPLVRARRHHAEHPRWRLADCFIDMWWGERYTRGTMGERDHHSGHRETYLTAVLSVERDRPCFPFARVTKFGPLTRVAPLARTPLTFQGIDGAIAVIGSIEPTPPQFCEPETDPSEPAPRR